MFCVLSTTSWGLRIVNRAESLPPDIGVRANHASGAPPDEVLLGSLDAAKSTVNSPRERTEAAKIPKN